MQLRVLQTIASARLVIPAGLLIEVARLTPELRTWIETGKAEIVRNANPPETTALGPEASAMLPAAEKGSRWRAGSTSTGRSRSSRSRLRNP